MPETDQANSEQSKEADDQRHALGRDSLPQLSPVGLPVGLWWIFILGGTLLVALLAVSVFLPNLSERVKFFTVNALSLLVLLAIVVQAYIYRRQWETMEQQRLETHNIVEQNERVVETMQGQLDIMRKQATIMSDSLIIGAQAYVCIHNVETDLVNNLLYISVENLGKVAADTIAVFVRMKFENLAEPDERIHDFRKLYKYGRGTELFAGSLKLVIRIPLEYWLNNEQLLTLKTGGALIKMYGDITFYDGFEPRRKKTTRFGYKYRSGDRRWVPLKIRLPEEVVEKAGQEPEKQNPNCDTPQKRQTKL